MSKLIEKRKEFEAKQKKLHTVFQQAGKELDMDKVTEIEGDSKAKATAIKKMNTELSDLGQEVEALVEIDTIAKSVAKTEASLNKPVVPQPEAKATGLLGPIEKKTIGQMFIESEAFKGFKAGASNGPVAHLDIDMKTVFSTAAGWAPETLRTGLMVPIATSPIRIIDIIPPGQTNQAAIVYMEETTYTNAAAGVDEAGAKPEATLALTERSSAVLKIAVWIPVTSEQLEDVAGIQSYINSRLTLMLKQRLDQYLLTGTGAAPQITGLLVAAGTQSFVLAGDQFDAVYEAIRRVSVIGRAEANVIVMHPNDWMQLRLMRTDDGLYILGNPSEPGPARIWGLPVVQSIDETEHSVLVGDFANYCQLFEKKGIDVEISNSHDVFFVYNKLAIRAEMRHSFPIYRPAAFCIVTAF